MRGQSRFCDSNVLLCMVRRGDMTYIPKGDFILHAGDDITVIIPPKEQKFFSTRSACRVRRSDRHARRRRQDRLFPREDPARFRHFGQDHRKTVWSAVSFCRKSCLRQPLSTATAPTASCSTRRVCPPAARSRPSPAWTRRTSCSPCTPDVTLRLVCSPRSTA